ATSTIPRTSSGSSRSSEGTRPARERKCHAPPPRCENSGGSDVALGGRVDRAQIAERLPRELSQRLLALEPVRDEEIEYLEARETPEAVAVSLDRRELSGPLVERVERGD